MTSPKFCQITVLRHGKADPNSIDRDRALNAKGREQATARRATLGNPKFDLIISSPALRARSTAAIVAGIDEGQVRVIDELYPDPTEPVLGAKLDVLFQRLAYAPVETYLKEDHDHILMEHSSLAWHALRDVIQVANVESVLVLSHAVVAPAMGIAACDGYRPIVETLKMMNLGECEGYRLLLGADWANLDIETINGP